MSSPDGISLPRDPGPVPVALREAFARASASEAVTLPLPEENDIELLAMGEGDDDVRLSTIDQLLITAEGNVVLAHVVAARGATVGSEGQIQSLTGAFPTRVSTAAPSPAPTPGVLEMPARRANPKRASWLVPFLLAASVLLVTVAGWRASTQEGVGDEIRASSADLQLRAVAPSTVSAPISLRWTPLRGDTRYSIEILDADDAPVFQRETGEPETIVSAGSLQVGTYRWYVRARMADQREIRSRVESFEVR